MKPEDKNRLREAFRKALEKSPAADTPIEGRFDQEGNPMTLRKLVERDLETEAFYQKIDAAIASGRVTLNEFIGKVSLLAHKRP